MAIRKIVSYKRNNKASGKKIALSKTANIIKLYSPETGSGDMYAKYSNVSHNAANRPKRITVEAKSSLRLKKTFEENIIDCMIFYMEICKQIISVRLLR